MLEKNHLNLKKYSVYLLLAGVLILIFFLSYIRVYDYDVGFHLRAGQWILDNLRFPGNDTFTWTSNHPYIDNYWLYQVVIAFINKISGTFGLVLFNSVLILISSFFIIYRVKRYSGQLNLVFVLIFLLSAFALSVQWSLRPHVLSWVYLNILLLLLEKYSESKNRKLLYYLPLVMLFWVNSHAQVFILGWVVIFSFWLGKLIETRKIDKILTYSFLASVAICFVNPYFEKGFLLPLDIFRMLQTGNVFKDTIFELNSTFSAAIWDKLFIDGHLTLESPIFKIFLLLIVLFFSLINGIRRRKAYEFILAALFLYLIYAAFKNVNYFIIVVFPFFVDGLITYSNSLIKLPRNRLKTKYAQLLENGLTVIILLFVIITIFRIANNNYYNGWRAISLEFGHSFNNNMLPVNAANFIKNYDIRGKILNHYNYGGYLMLALDQKVFIDGRADVMGENFYNEHQNIKTPAGKSYIVEKYSPEIVIFPYRLESSWVFMFGFDPNWRLVYFDENAAVYLKKGFRDDVKAVNYNQYSYLLKKRSDSEINEILTTKKSTGLFDGIFQSRYLPEYENNLALFMYYNAWCYESIDIALEGIRKSDIDYSIIFYNLGEVFYSISDFKNSAISYKRFLEINKAPTEMQLKYSNERISEIASADLNNPEYYRNTAVKYINNNDFFRAIFAYRQALSRQKNFIWLNELGNIYYETNQLDSAFKCFAQAVQVQPGYPVSYFNLANVYLKSGNRDKAEQLWQKSLEIDAAFQPAKEMLNRLRK